MHTDIDALEVVCQHYRATYRDELIVTQRRMISALIKTVHELTERLHDKVYHILDLTRRITLLNCELALVRNAWRGAWNGVWRGAIEDQ